MLRVVTSLLMLAGCLLGDAAGVSRSADPAAQLELSQLLPNRAGSVSATLTFISNTSLAVCVCSGYTCSLSLIRWIDGTLGVVTTTHDFGPILMNRHRTPGDSVLAIGVTGSTVLYSSDLSSRRALQPVSKVSSSGRISAQSVRGGWQLYRFDEAQAIRSGKGSVRSVSDEVVVFQEGNTLHIETIEGSPVGSFRVPPESKCYTQALVLRDDRLYLDDCKAVRLVDFGGRTTVKFEKPKDRPTSSFDFDRSADGSRLLFDSWSRKVSFWRNAGEIAVALATFGMGVGDEEDNREKIRVTDSTSGAVCFERHRRLPLGMASFYYTAALSPSGEFVAIAADGTLYIYRLPAVCESDP